MSHKAQTGSLTKFSVMDRGVNDGFNGGLVTTTFPPNTNSDALPPSFPCVGEFYLLMDVVWSAGAFVRLVEWCGVRYTLRLELNKDEERCSENVHLKRMCEAGKSGDYDALGDV